VWSVKAHTPSGDITLPVAGGTFAAAQQLSIEIDLAKREAYFAGITSLCETGFPGLSPGLSCTEFVAQMKDEWGVQLTETWSEERHVHVHMDDRGGFAEKHEALRCNVKQNRDSWTQDGQ
jgi:hypothetical protein